MLHRKNIKLAVTFAGLAIIMCAPAAFGQATTQDLQFSNSPVTNDCNGETILMSGTLHSEMSFSTNSNGMTHTNYNALFIDTFATAHTKAGVTEPGHVHGAARE